MLRSSNDLDRAEVHCHGKMMRILATNCGTLCDDFDQAQVDNAIELCLAKFHGNVESILVDMARGSDKTLHSIAARHPKSSEPQALIDKHVLDSLYLDPTGKVLAPTSLKNAKT